MAETKRQGATIFLAADCAEPCEGSQNQNTGALVL